MAHVDSTGSHCGIKGTLARLYRCIPGPTSTAFAGQCAECQKQAKHTKQRVSLHPLPIVGTQIRRITFDIVGLYPRTACGFRYILSSNCYFSRYPEATPLKWLMRVASGSKVKRTTQCVSSDFDCTKAQLLQLHTSQFSNRTLPDCLTTPHRGSNKG